MHKYEVTYIVGPMTEETEDRVLQAFDCISGETHGGQAFITLTAVGPNAVEAIKSAAFKLQMEFGVEIRRVEFDLATRGELAYRLDKTPQAVGLWVRGERHAHEPFPATFNDVAGGVWLWGDVVAWVREVLDEDPADGLLFPEREQIDEANACLRRGYAEVVAPEFTASFEGGLQPTPHVVNFREPITGTWSRQAVPSKSRKLARHG